MSTQRTLTQKITELEHLLQYEFHNKELLRQAITHSTAINERHPEAYNRDLNPLSFFGDAVLKYAVVRQLYVNGRDDISPSQDALHKDTQKFISNAALAKVAREKLHLERYLIRGGNHQDLSVNMYADCLEAIFGAIALDCADDQKRLICEVIPRICSLTMNDPLNQTRENESRTTHTLGTLMQSKYTRGRADDYDKNWPMILLEPSLTNSKRNSQQHRRGCWKTLGRCCLYPLILLILLCICFIVVILFMEYQSKPTTKSRWFEL